MTGIVPTSIETETWGNYNFEKPSVAIVAAGISNGLVVIATAGPHVRMEMEEYGLCANDILPFPEIGIWIWEGIGVWYSGPYEDPTSGETRLEGKYREPTLQEWEAIRKGECPWDDEEWKLKV